MNTSDSDKEVGSQHWLDERCTIPPHAVGPRTNSWHFRVGAFYRKEFHMPATDLTGYEIGMPIKWDKPIRFRRTRNDPWKQSSLVARYAYDPRARVHYFTTASGTLYRLQDMSPSSWESLKTLIRYLIFSMFDQK